MLMPKCFGAISIGYGREIVRFLIKTDYHLIIVVFGVAYFAFNEYFFR